jgi:hypothetical protein
MVLLKLNESRRRFDQIWATIGHDDELAASGKDGDGVYNQLSRILLYHLREGRIGEGVFARVKVHTDSSSRGEKRQQTLFTLINE